MNDNGEIQRLFGFHQDSLLLLYLYSIFDVVDKKDQNRAHRAGGGGQDALPARLPLRRRQHPQHHLYPCRRVLRTHHDIRSPLGRRADLGFIRQPKVQEHRAASFEGVRSHSPHV